MCPIYEYYCDDCKNTFELLQKSDAVPWCTCTNCLWQANRVDCPGGGFQIYGAGVYSPSKKDYQGG